MTHLPIKKNNKQAILLVHGMGANRAPEVVPAAGAKPPSVKPGAFGDDFIAATTAALNAFKAHEKESLADYFDIHEFNYDAWFDKMRTEMAANAKDMSKALGNISAAHGVSIPFGLVERLTSLEARFGDDKFFFTHWLDVIFYGTMLGAKIRVDAGAMIADVVGVYGGKNVHVIAHSLGTAVLHDTLHLLYRPESDPNDEIPDLDRVNHKLGSVWLFANVSRLVNSVTRLTDPLGSTVRPGDNGCTAALVNVRHELDPFTWLARFDPRNDGNWIPEPIYTSSYANLVTDLIVDPNTHSFPQYLQDPKVTQSLLPFLLGSRYRGKPAEEKAAADARAQLSLPGKYAALEDALDDALKDPGQLDGWKDFLTNASVFTDAIKSLGGKFS